MKTVPKLDITIPDHTILDKIGEGGMSAVYLGRQLSLQRKVAIKVLKKLVMEDKLLAERFVDEAKTVASLDHPHIISIYEAKKLPSGLAYFTMPYLTHGDFSEIICTNAEHLIDLLGQICDGLSHAHEHGVIHRDLKPENILFDQFGRIKIADFGIAISKKSQRKTKETQLLGSAHYMSPEQIQSKPIDHRSDIYSLGCIIYEKITGDHVFNGSGSGDFSILMAHINKPIPVLPADLSLWQPIIDKSLAKDPDQRYQSVADLKADLMKIRYQDNNTENETNKSPNPLKKWILPAAVVGFMVAIVILGIILSTDNTAPNPNETKPVQREIVAEPTKSQATKSTTPPAALAKSATEQSPPIDLMETVITLPENRVNSDDEPNLTAQLAVANDSLKAFRLTKPSGDNAAEQYAAILKQNPDNTAARRGLHKVGLYYFSLIDSKLDQQAYGDALTHISSLNDFVKDYPVEMSDYASAVSKISDQAITYAQRATDKRRSNPQAKDYLAMAMALDPHNTDLQSTQLNYQRIPQTGDVVTDLSGYQWVFVAAPANAGFTDFYLAQRETTVKQFSAFAADKDFSERCEHFGRGGFFKKTWDNPPFNQTPQHPVVCITAGQVQAYASWLSSSQNSTYRLPTAGEWQWAQQKLNANPGCQQANIAGSETKTESKFEQQSNCQDDFVFTAPVASLTMANNSYDLSGNVAEWITACGGQGDLCTAGGSWKSSHFAQTKQLQKADATIAQSHIGFRLIKPILN